VLAAVLLEAEAMEAAAVDTVEAMVEAKEVSFSRPCFFIFAN
jgi:hypothetical protein